MKRPASFLSVCQSGVDPLGSCYHSMRVSVSQVCYAGNSGEAPEAAPNSALVGWAHGGSRNNLVARVVSTHSKAFKSTFNRSVYGIAELASQTNSPRTYLRGAFGSGEATGSSYTACPIRRYGRGITIGRVADNQLLQSASVPERDPDLGRCVAELDVQGDITAADQLLL